VGCRAHAGRAWHRETTPHAGRSPRAATAPADSPGGMPGPRAPALIRETSVVLAAGLQPIPGYRLTRPLGSGAFAEVWEAQDGAGRAVALKFLDCRTKPTDLIRSEIKVLRGLSELQHPHIIRMHVVYASARYIVLSMERADGNLNDLRQTYV